VGDFFAYFVGLLRPFGRYLAQCRWGAAGFFVAPETLPDKLTPASAHGLSEIGHQGLSVNGKTFAQLFYFEWVKVFNFPGTSFGKAMAGASLPSSANFEPNPP
jgi:hypothetical protein